MKANAYILIGLTAAIGLLTFLYLREKSDNKQNDDTEVVNIKSSGKPMAFWNPDGLASFNLDSQGRFTHSTFLTRSAKDTSYFLVEYNLGDTVVVVSRFNKSGVEEGWQTYFHQDGYIIRQIYFEGTNRRKTLNYSYGKNYSLQVK